MREKKEKLQEQEEPFDLKKEIFEWVKIIIAAAAIAFFLNTFIIANSTVPSGSMETTIMTGDRIIGSRLAYKLGGDPERGDIVIFDHETGPGNEETRLVKRVIGLPGETVEIRDNQLYIDG
ncbi:signal peptidase I, partial [Hungatella effluvii]